MFYCKKWGAIKSVKIEKPRKKKAAFSKANYALVEFAHKDSVEVKADDKLYTQHSWKVMSFVVTTAGS